MPQELQELLRHSRAQHSVSLEALSWHAGQGSAGPWWYFTHLIIAVLAIPAISATILRSSKTEVRTDKGKESISE